MRIRSIFSSALQLHTGLMAKAVTSFPRHRIDRLAHTIGVSHGISSPTMRQHESNMLEMSKQWYMNPWMLSARSRIHSMPVSSSSSSTTDKPNGEKDGPPETPWDEGPEEQVPFESFDAQIKSFGATFTHIVMKSDRDPESRHFTLPLDVMTYPEEYIPVSISDPRDRTLQKMKKPSAFEVDLAAEPVGSPLSQLKRAVVRPTLDSYQTFNIKSDEGALLHGTDSAPSPLSYLAAGVACCLLSQITLLIKQRGLKVDRVKVEQRMQFARHEDPFFAETSDGAPDLDKSPQVMPEGECKRMDAYVMVQSEEDEETIQKLVHDAEKASYALQAMVRPTACRVYSYHNPVRWSKPV